MKDQDEQDGSAAGDAPSQPGKAPRRRFIAGAVCPACAAMDRIVIETAGSGQTVRRCVACGFSDELMPASGSLPSTRFTRLREAGGTLDADAQSAVSKVRIVEPRDDE